MTIGSCMEARNGTAIFCSPAWNISRSIPNFRNDLGFIRRTRRSPLQPVFRRQSPGPTSGESARCCFPARWDTLFDHSNRLIRRIDHYVVQVTFQSGDLIRTSPQHYNFDRVKEPFEISPGVTVPRGQLHLGRLERQLPGQSRAQALRQAGLHPAIRLLRRGTSTFGASRRC